MALKVLGVVTTPVKGETNTEFLCQAVLDGAKAEGEDVETELIRLADVKIVSGCDQCNWCLLRQTPERFCSKNDDMEMIYPKLIEADAWVIATPVYIGRMCWLTAAFIDRLRALAEGRYYGLRGPLGGVMFNQVVTSASVAWVRHGGVETAQISVMFAAGIYGWLYVTAGFGFGAGGVSAAPLGEYGAVRKDRFAMRNARDTGARLVQVARIVKAGKQALRYVPAYVR
jgi:multimeric flavodoxin WrbA